MSKARILIVEDEPFISDDLAETLKECGYSVAGVAADIDETLPILRQGEVDLVLLDINLNQPVDGVQIAHIINSDYRVPFIFVTAFTDSATIERVKHTRPAGYLSKPYNDVDLIITIELALSRTKAPELARSKDNGASTDTLFIKTRKGLEKIKVAEIRWIEAYDYYSFVKLKDDKLLATLTLKELEQKIDHPSFLKIHRKYSVNFDHIDKIVGNQVEIDGELLPVSRSHKDDLLAKLQTI